MARALPVRERDSIATNSDLTEPTNEMPAVAVAARRSRSGPSPTTVSEPRPATASNGRVDPLLRRQPPEYEELRPCPPTPSLGPREVALDSDPGAIDPVLNVRAADEVAHSEEEVDAVERASSHGGPSETTPRPCWQGEIPDNSRGLLRATERVRHTPHMSCRHGGTSPGDT